MRRFTISHLSPLASLPRAIVFLLIPRPPSSTLFPYTTLFRSTPPCRVGTRTEPHPMLIPVPTLPTPWRRSEEHTSELQSLRHLVCRLLLEKKKDLSGQPSARTTGRPKNWSETANNGRSCGGAP